MNRIIFVFFLTAFLFSGCKKESFRTESKWLAPLLNTSLGVEDLVPDSLLSKNSDNTLDLVYDYTYSINNIDDVLEVPDRTDTLEASLSSLTLEDREFSDTLTLLEIDPLSLLLHGRTEVVPAQNQTLNEGTVIDVTEQFFTTATFLDGYIDIEIYNELPVEAELIEFQLLNNKDQSVVLDGEIKNLVPNARDAQTYSLANKTVDGVLELKLKRIITKASDGPVLVDVYKGLQVKFKVRDLKPKSATAIFPAQNLIEREDETKYSFGGAELTWVIIKTGNVLMRVESTIEEVIVLEYEIPNSTKQGAPGPIRKEWTIPAAEPGGTVQIEEKFPIDGYNIELGGKNKYETPTFNHVFNTLKARIEYSGIERTLSLDDKIKIEFGLVDVKPYLIVGDPSKHVANVKDTFSLESLKKIGGGISLEDATFEINIANGFGIEALLEVQEILGVNSRKPKNVALISTELNNPILLGKAINNAEFIPFQKQVVLNGNNSNLKQFLENIPESVIPSLKATIRPNGTIDQNDFAFDFSSLDANFKLVVPLKVGLDSLTFSNKQKVNLLSDEKVENIKELKLIVRADNWFPISGTLEMEFLDESDNVLTTLFRNTNNTLTAAELDPLIDKVSLPVESELTTTLSSSEILIIQNAAKVNIVARFNTESAQRFNLLADYKVDLKLISEVVYEGNL